MPEPSSSSTTRNSWREARYTLLVWLVALCWTVGYSYLRGYEHDPESWLARQGWGVPRGAHELVTIAGMPEWIFNGVLVPWVVCGAVTIAFALFGMSDDDLGREMEDPHAS